jgi:multidrug efflux pump subunit AcrA (membrane-fusion protein)
MSKQYLYFIAIVLLYSSCGEKTSEIQPVQKELVEAVYASGTLVPQVEYKVMASAEGYLQEQWVKEGDSIRSGQSLFQLSSVVTQAQKQAANAVLEQTVAVAGISAPIYLELEQKLNAAQLRHEHDKEQYLRYKNLYAEGAIAKATFEKYELQYQTSQREVAGWKQQLQQQVRNGKLQVQQATSSRQVSAAGASRLQLSSSINGVVYEIYKQKGDLVTPGQSVALVGSGNMIARLMVDEEDLVKVQQGQKVWITLDAYPGKLFKATVQRIYPILNKVEQSFRVDALLEEPLPQAIYGLNIEANIIIQQSRKVWVIPQKAIIKGDSVDVKQNGTIRRIKIQKGIEDGEWVEVRSGLNSSSLLILPQ